MRKIIAIALILVWTGMSQAQTFHGIIMADTDDEGVGAGCSIDVGLISGQFKKIAAGIGYEEKTIILDKEKFNERALLEFIENLKCGPNDVVFFYYTGHGYNLKERPSNYPLLQIEKKKDKIKTNLALDDVHKEFCKKGGKFVVSVGDCCNEVIDADAPASRDVVVAKVLRATSDFYRKLFLENEGSILITSARPPQLSPTHPQIGSLYTVAFTQAMTYGEAYNNKSVTWKQLLSDADNRLQTLRNDFKATNPQMASQIQIPIYTLEIKPAAAVTPSAPSAENPVAQSEEPRPSSLDYDRINRYLNTLVNEDLPDRERYQLSKNWKDYFTIDATVDVFVNTTLVERQSIEAAIEQLYLNASLIRNVNFIGDLSKLTTDGKKYLSIAIQQIRR